MSQLASINVLITCIEGTVTDHTRNDSLISFMFRCIQNALLRNFRNKMKMIFILLLCLNFNYSNVVEYYFDVNLFCCMCCGAKFAPYDKNSSCPSSISKHCACQSNVSLIVVFCMTRCCSLGLLACFWWPY